MKYIGIGIVVFMVCVSVVFATVDPVFPQCSIERVGDIAHYKTGIHQIFDGPLLEGSDDVYSHPDGFVQCFCDASGSGIQTNWWKMEGVHERFASSSGSQWGLGDYTYQVQNRVYDCRKPTPTVTVTPSAIITPTQTEQLVTPPAQLLPAGPPNTGFGI